MDIVQRLRLAAPEGLTAAHVSDLAVLREAANEIERLRAELHRWKQPPTQTGTKLVGD